MWPAFAVEIELNTEESKEVKEFAVLISIPSFLSVILFI